MTRLELESAALEAFRERIAWQDFWNEHGAAVYEAEPADAVRRDRLERRLLHLVVTGDEGGMFAVGDPDAADPWRVDDAPSPHDTETRARLILT